MSDSDPGPIAVGPFSAHSGRVGVLVLHGFTGSVHSVRPLAEAFANAGFYVEAPLLPGHGTTPADLATKSWADFRKAVEAEYLAIEAACEQVLVAGLSMGGTLAVDLAASHRGICGLVLVNPFVEPPAAAFRSILRRALESGASFVPSIGSDIARPGVQGGGYHETPIAPLLSLSEAIEEVAPRLSEITCPTLLFSSRVDHVVPTSAGDLVEATIGGELERVYLENSLHVATLDVDAAEIEARAVAFAHKVSAA